MRDSWVSELAAFITEARKDGYASGKEAVKDPGKVELPGFEEFVFKRNSTTHKEIIWTHRDDYRGSRAFGGRELVRLDEEPVWTQSYQGRITPDLQTQTPEHKILIEEIYRFLRSALRETGYGFRPRGLEKFFSGDWKYYAEWQGSVEWLFGAEKIITKVDKKKTLVYEGHFSGLILKD